jgi:hypothetical protein
VLLCPADHPQDHYTEHRDVGEKDDGEAYASCGDHAGWARGL